MLSDDESCRMVLILDSRVLNDVESDEMFLEVRANRVQECLAMKWF